jgi:transposase
LLPKTSTYIVEVVYEKPVTVANFNPKYIAGIDLAIDNLVAMAANTPTFRPTIYDGNHLKSSNPGFNKRARPVTVATRNRKIYRPPNPANHLKAKQASRKLFSSNQQFNCQALGVKFAFTDNYHRVLI